MLTIEVPKKEFFIPDGDSGTFCSIPSTTIVLEHSLVSLSKWESKWKIPLLDKRYPKTDEQVVDYIRCMTVTKNVNPLVYMALSQENIDEVEAYIGDSMTATWFSDEEEKTTGQSAAVTAEVIYAWMVNLSIPVELERWHINRLLTLIHVLSEFNKPKDKKKKQSRASMLARREAINEARKKKYNTKG